jgi:hypothetical protein
VEHAYELTPLQVVFKALIVLHTMIRNGATDNVLQYLSSSEVLRLKNVVGGQWEGNVLVLAPHLIPLSVGFNRLTMTRAFARTVT